MRAFGSGCARPRRAHRRDAAAQPVRVAGGASAAGRDADAGSGCVLADRAFGGGSRHAARRRLDRRVGEDGTVLQVDHYRADGTLVLSDRRDVRERGRARRAIGRALRRARGPGPVVGPHPSPLSRLARRAHRQAAVVHDRRQQDVGELHARLPAAARRDRARRAQLPPRALSVRRSARSARRVGRCSSRLDAFDVVAVLSERQRRDIVAAHGEHPGLTVIANPRAGRAARPEQAGPARRHRARVAHRAEAGRPRGAGRRAIRDAARRLRRRRPRGRGARRRSPPTPPLASGCTATGRRPRAACPVRRSCCQTAGSEGFASRSHRGDGRRHPPDRLRRAVRAGRRHRRRAERPARAVRRRSGDGRRRDQTRARCRRGRSPACAGQRVARRVRTASAP